MDLRDRQKSFTFKYELRGGDGAVYGRGESVMVMYDYGSGKTIPIPDRFLERIGEYSE